MAHFAWSEEESKGHIHLGQEVATEHMLPTPKLLRDDVFPSMLRSLPAIATHC